MVDYVMKELCDRDFMASRSVTGRQSATFSKIDPAQQWSTTYLNVLN